MLAVFQNVNITLSSECIFDASCKIKDCIAYDRKSKSAVDKC